MNILKKGSSGNDVKELQKLLNAQGYNLDEDGVYGSKTESAVRDYQSKNGLTSDGIYGQNTYNSLNGSQTVPTAVAPTEQKKTTSDWLADYEAKPTEYQPSQTLQNAEAMLADYEARKPEEYQPSQAVNDAAEMLKNYEANKPGAYQGTYDQQINDILNDIMSQGKFQYDFNADPLYQQYKNNYTNLGQMAMMDTMGNASALSGGFGNSYAQTAGQQAYQQYLGQLNNVIPELYNAAYNRYADERADKYNQLNTYRDLDASEYGRYRDSYNDYYNELNYLYNKYNDVSQEEYNRYRDSLNDYYTDLDYYYGKYNDMSQDEYNRYRDNIADWQNERNYWYNKSQDELDQSNWERQFALSQSKSSGGGSGRGGGGDDTEEMYVPSTRDIIDAASYAYKYGGESALASTVEDAYQAGLIDDVGLIKDLARYDAGKSGAISPVSQMAMNGTGYINSTSNKTSSNKSTTSASKTSSEKKEKGKNKSVAK